MLQPTSAAMLDFLPPAAYPHLPATSFATKFVHVSTNKIRTAVNAVLFMPDGRRLLTCSQNGEFTMWNGMSFNFETILQAHNCAIRAAAFSHNENWLISGDDAGTLKYWQTNLNNLKSISGAHSEPVRGVAFASTDLKFCSCSDDTTVKVWDFARAQMTSALTGHGGDVKSVDWHPRQALLASGGKDSLVKLWDAKSGSAVATIHAHKNQVGCVKWNQNGNWLVSGCRSQVKVFDVRTLREISNFRGHAKEVTSVAWHPHHENLLTTGPPPVRRHHPVLAGGSGRGGTRGGRFAAGTIRYPVPRVAPRGAHHVQRVERQHVQVLVSQQTGGGAQGHDAAFGTGGDGGTSTGGVHDERVGREGDQRGRVGVSTGGNRRGKTGRRRRAGNRPRRQSRAAAARAAAGEATRQHRRREDHRRPRRRRARRGDRRGGRGGAGASASEPSPLRRLLREGRAERGAPGRRRASRRGWGPNARRDPGVVRGRSVRTRAGRDVNDAGWDWEPTRVARRSSVCRVVEIGRSVRSDARMATSRRRGCETKLFGGSVARFGSRDKRALGSKEDDTSWDAFVVSRYPRDRSWSTSVIRARRLARAPAPAKSLARR